MHRTSTPEDTVIGAPLGAPPFADRRFVAAPPRAWPRFGPARYTAAVAGVLRALRPELIEVHNRPEIATGLARRFRRTPITLFLHNDPQAMRRSRSPAQRRALLARMRIVCVSEALRARFLDGLPDADVLVLPNCIERADFPPPPASRDKLILFAGRLVADKGADAFVRACARILPELPGWRAEMIGADRFSADSPATPFLDRLRPAAAAAGIRLLGHLPHEAVLRAMSLAAIVVVPSRWQEPFGMTALEAMAAGAALIVSPRPGLLEVVGDAALLADPDEAGALERALLQLAGDAALCAALGAGGLQRAARFDAAAARDRLAVLRRERLK